MSFLVRTSLDEDKPIWKKTFGKQYDLLLRPSYEKNTNTLQKLRTLPLNENVLTNNITEEQVNDFASKHNGPTHLLPMVALVNPLHRFIMKADVPNFVHPIFRLVAMPVAATVAFLDVFNTYNTTKAAGFDESTARSESFARATYQLTTNFLIPYTIFRTISGSLRNTSMKAAGTYGGLAVGVAASIALSGVVRNCIESCAINLRMRRKDYSGGHLQTWGHMELEYDNPWDIYLNKKHATEPTSEYLDLFPNFMIAEASPAFEVPVETADFVGHNPTVVSEAIATDNITNAQGLITRIPAPTMFTFGRDSDRFAEYSLASPSSLARDERLGLITPPAPLTDESTEHMLTQVRKLRLAHEQAMAKYQH